MQWLIANAHAQEAAGGLAAQGTGGFMSLMPMFLIILVFYFLIIRPQSRKMKEHQGMLNTLERGDRVVTSGGIMGKITEVNKDDDTFGVEIANGVVVYMRRSAITEALDKKPTPANKPKLAKKQSV